MANTFRNVYLKMMLFVAFLPAFLVSVTCASVRNDCIFPSKTGNQADYYWRDYFGTVPNDAVAGGFDVDGNVTFIGQIPDVGHSGIYLGNIFPGKKEADGYSYGRRISVGTYVKILCSHPSNKFEWISTSATDSHLITDYHWVIGGIQGTELNFVGRANVEGHVQVGRVFSSQSSNRGLYLYTKDGKRLLLQTFEMLVIPR